MEIIYAERIADYDVTVAALGNFDGLHIAHMQIIKNGIKTARERGLKAGVLLFEENTKNMISGGNVGLITPNDEKLRLLKNEGADFVYIRKFTPEFMKLSPEDFVRLLVKNLKVKAVCVGYDYSFGHMAAGNTDTLTALGEKYGFETLVTPRVIIDGKTVSSTYIRELISSGSVDKVKPFLGRDYSLSGTVAHGFENGRKMGFPTANLEYDAAALLPMEGVYAGITEVCGKRYKSVINVGKNLTFGAQKLTVESHLIDFRGDIYGEKIRIYFLKRLRGVKKFGGADELKAQIESDKEKTTAMNITVTP
ncbi:MAG: bifunctional riboflavin kinase/FAD synthetase [Firmicutes bacterium]|nr:bifunctional riboflavin kinase/FAD synthetase [Bacillota bacterium]